MGSLSAVFKRHLTLNFPELLQGRSVLALSGGIDSMVLCELLLDAEVDFSVAHCNFQLRGSDSDEDEKFVEEKARNLNLEVHLKNSKLKIMRMSMGCPCNSLRASFAISGLMKFLTRPIRTT